MHKNEHDITGNKYGELTALYKSDRKTYWFFKCDCGNIKEIVKGNVTLGKSKSCGCKINVLKNNLIGKKFERLYVVERYLKILPVTYKCECDCGKIVNVRSCGLLSGNNKSCGCYKNDMSKQRCGEKHPGWKHGRSHEDRVKYRQEKIPEKESWRKHIFERDEYKCVVCGSKNTLNAHHLNGWNWCKEERYDKLNGICLCSHKDGCHTKFHSEYGRGNNTAAQFEEFLNQNFNKSLKDILPEIFEEKIINDANKYFRKKWGYYADYHRTDNCVMKKLVIYPDQSISTQYHNTRNEFWFIESGDFELLIDDKILRSSAPYNCIIHSGVLHKVKNIGKTDLIIYEMQFGDLCDENDIVRTEDQYGRITVHL